MRLALKLFRGEPAISEFDWNFSATHNSSAAFSTEVGSALHEILLSLQPDHGQVTRFRAHCMLLNALFRLALATPPVLKTLSSQHTIARRTVLQKVPYHTLMCSMCLQAQGFRFYFTPLPGSFSPFPHGTISLSVTKQYLALWGGPHIFIRDYTCLVLLWILPCPLTFHLLDFHYLWSAFPNSSVKSPESIMQSITPPELLPTVQALPLSLATTQGIEFSFFSCRY